MKKVVSLITAVVLSSACSVVSASQGIYFGAKSGSMDIDVDAYDTSTPTGFLAGYQFNKNISAEAEYTSTDIDFKITDNITAEGEITTFALYGVYRTEGDFYGKVKAGVLSEEIELKHASSSIKTDDSGLSVGAGVGYRFGDFSFEAEYTLVEEDVNFFSIGANYHF